MRPPPDRSVAYYLGDDNCRLWPDWRRDALSLDKVRMRLIARSQRRHDWLRLGMRKIESDSTGPLELTGPTLLSGTVVGNVVVLEGANVRLTGEIVGTVIVRPTGTLVLIGRVKGAVINEGGTVDIFGFVGRVTDTGDTESWAAVGAIVGGQRIHAPMKISQINYRGQRSQNSQRIDPASSPNCAASDTFRK